MPSSLCHFGAHANPWELTWDLCVGLGGWILAYFPGGLRNGLAVELVGGVQRVNRILVGGCVGEKAFL